MWRGKQVIENHPQDAAIADGTSLSNHYSDWFLRLKDQVNRGNVPGGTLDILAGDGIQLPGAVTNVIIRVQSATAGNVDIVANPQIEYGFDGQYIMLEGMSDTKTVQLDNGDGLKLAGGASFTLGLDDTISFIFNLSKSLWIETNRSDN